MALEEYDRCSVEVLAREFRAAPIGRHSPALHRLLLLLRALPETSRLGLVCTRPFEEWALVRLPTSKEGPITLLGESFGSLEAAEWAIFCRRIEAAFGWRLEECAP